MSTKNSKLSFEDISSYSRWFKPLIIAEQIETCREQNATIQWTKPANQEKGSWLVNYIPDSIKRIDRCKKGDEFALEFIPEDKADHWYNNSSLPAIVKYGYKLKADSTNNNKLNLILKIPKKHNDELLQLLKNSDFVQNSDGSFRASDYNITVVDTSKDIMTAIQLGAIKRLELYDIIFERDNQDLVNLLLGGVNFNIDNQLTPYNDPNEKFSSNCESGWNKEGINELNNLNESQRAAVDEVLCQRVTLIDGPPGTGKTKTAAAIVYQLYCLMRSKDDTNAGRQRASEADSDEDSGPSFESEAETRSDREKTAADIIPELRIANRGYGLREKLLVCAQSNVAVDNIVERLDKAGLNVVRVRSVEQQEIGPNPQLSLDVKIAVSDGYCFDKLRQVKKMIESGERANCRRLYLAARSRRMAKEDYSDESDDDEDLDTDLMVARLRDELTRECEYEVLSRTDVVCCTLIGSAKLWSKHLLRIHYNTLLIDESCQATEPECLVPITLWPRRLVMIGDERQLGPQVNSKDINSEITTLFTRFKIRKHNQLKSKLLNLQYRMHPSISYFPTRHFYNGNVTDGIDGSQRNWMYGAKENPFLKPNEPLMFHCCNDPEESFSTSYRNEGEAYIIKSIVLKLLKTDVTSDKIGIISPYKAQQDAIRRVLELAVCGESQCYDTSELQIATVDGFQGKEKDFIIMSCVRCNEEGTIGFLKDDRRLNVALTRAKYGLIIVGNPRTLNRDPLWSKLLADMDSRNLLCVSVSLRKDSRYKVRATTLRNQLYQMIESVFNSNHQSTCSSKPSGCNIVDDSRKEFIANEVKTIRQIRDILDGLTLENSESSMSSFEKLSINTESSSEQVIKIILARASAESDLCVSYAKMCSLKKSAEVGGVSKEV